MAAATETGLVSIFPLQATSHFTGGEIPNSIRPKEPSHNSVMCRSELAGKFEMAIVSHRRIPVDEANFCVRILSSIFIRDKNLEALHRIFGNPMIAIKVRGGPDHLGVAIHPGVVS